MSKVYLLIYSIFMFIVTLAMNISVVFAGIHWTRDKILFIGILSVMGYIGAVVAFPYKIKFE